MLEVVSIAPPKMLVNSTINSSWLSRLPSSSAAINRVRRSSRGFERRLSTSPPTNSISAAKVALDRSRISWVTLGPKASAPAPAICWPIVVASSISMSRNDITDMKGIAVISFLTSNSPVSACRSRSDRTCSRVTGRTFSTDLGVRARLARLRIRRWSAPLRAPMEWRRHS